MRDLGERIASVGQNLTPTERRLAEIILDDPTAVAFGTVADLAGKATTSGPSVVRFATKLDFDGFGQMQAHVRKTLAEQLQRPTDRIRETTTNTDSDGLTELKTSLAKSLHDTLRSIDDNKIDRLAEAIAYAEGRVLVLCAETSAAPGRLLADNLRLLRPGVLKLETAPAILATELADAGSDDVAVIIDFPRYETTVLDAGPELVHAGCGVVAITDGPLSPLASIADIWFGVGVDTVGPFDSVLPSIALIELVVAKVAALLRSQAGDRLDRIESLWTGSEVYQHENPKG